MFIYQRVIIYIYTYIYHMIYQASRPHHRVNCSHGWQPTREARRPSSTKRVLPLQCPLVLPRAEGNGACLVHGYLTPTRDDIKKSAEAGKNPPFEFGSSTCPVHLLITACDFLVIPTFCLHVFTITLVVGSKSSSPSLVVGSFIPFLHPFSCLHVVDRVEGSQERHAQYKDGSSRRPGNSCTFPEGSMRKWGSSSHTVTLWFWTQNAAETCWNHTSVVWKTAAFRNSWPNRPKVSAD